MAEEKKQKEEPEKSDVETFKELVTFMLKTWHSYSFAWSTWSPIPSSLVLAVFGGVGLFVMLRRGGASTPQIDLRLARMETMLEYQTHLLKRITNSNS